MKFVFLLLVFASINLIASCNGCDCSLDTSANNSSPGVAIPGLDGGTSDITKCISGSSKNNDKDYYYFTVDTNGILDIQTSSPNNHEYHMEVWNFILWRH